MLETAKIIFYLSHCLYVALDYIISMCESLSHGNLGAKGSSGTGWKDSVRGGILRVINVNLV